VNQKLLWWHCYAGIAGDMALASLVDAGADLDAIVKDLGALGVDGWTLRSEPVLRAGVAATRIDVEVANDRSSRTHGDIARLLADAALPERVRDRALAVFSALAQVEGRLHRVAVDLVHFHEVGGIDAIIDVVGTCLALEALGVDRVSASAVATGTGLIRSAHGPLPNPPPAVLGLLAGAPMYGRDLPVELTTPTGAALLAALCESWGPMPAMTVQATGYGAGSRDLDGLPNTTQAVIGEAISPGAGADRAGQPVMLLEANLDDVTGEVLAHTVTALLRAGAHDAWITPIVMKKGRPAHTVSMLVDPARTADLAAVLLKETGTLGVRGQQLTRWPMARTFVEVEVEGLPVRVKVSGVRHKAEYEDAAAAAERLGLSLREVTARAEQLAGAEISGPAEYGSGPPV
jgi:uncharacterized protein (TIGR00299 family) protein